MRRLLRREVIVARKTKQELRILLVAVVMKLNKLGEHEVANDLMDLVRKHFPIFP
jgi:hypothetical protein